MIMVRRAILPLKTRVARSAIHAAATTLSAPNLGSGVGIGVGRGYRRRTGHYVHLLLASPGPGVN